MVNSRLLWRWTGVLGVALGLAGGAAADDPYGLERSRREWRQTEAHHDAIIESIRNRPSKSYGSGGVAPVYKTPGQIAREHAAWKQQWEEDADDERAERDAWNDHLRAFADRERERASVIRIVPPSLADQQAFYNLLRQSQLKGFGSKLRPPFFGSATQGFDWHLQQAQAGDPYGAFYVGRAFLEGKVVAQNDTTAALWLAKSNLEWPQAAALYGSLLVGGRGVQPDAKRGRELLERGAYNDHTGLSAWIYGSILRDGKGVPPDLNGAALQLALATYRATQPEPGGPSAERFAWSEPVGAWEARASLIRGELRDFVLVHPKEVANWITDWAKDAGVSSIQNATQSARPDGERFAAQHALSALMQLLNLGDASIAGVAELRLGYLDLIEDESNGLDWLRTDPKRIEALTSLASLDHPDASARALLPWRSLFSQRGGSIYMTFPDTTAQNLWAAGGARIEAWAKSDSRLRDRAARALLARDLGRWPQVTALQSPEVVVARLQTLSSANAAGEVANEIVALANDNVAPWNDRDKTLAWIDKAMALEPRLKSLRESYLNRRDLDSEAGREKRFREAKAKLAAHGETFSDVELQAAARELEQADAIRASNRLAAYDGFVRAFEGGDALAGWQLLDMMRVNFIPFAGFGNEEQYLIDTTNARLQRDAAGEGEGDRAATAALALHFLHTARQYPPVYGVNAVRYWKPTQPSERDWLAVAREKGHPWAIASSNHDAARKADNKYGEEDQKVWPWLAKNFPILVQKSDLWRRDARLLLLYSPEGDIAQLQKPLSFVAAANLDAAKFRDLTPRLAAARSLCAAYAARTGATDPKRAKAFWDKFYEAAILDDQVEQKLPVRRAERLENLVQAAIYGDAYAPFEIGVLLKNPGFPLQPDAQEAAAWFGMAQNRLGKIAQTGSVNDAIEAASLLGREFYSGANFSKDPVRTLKYYTLAATLGDAGSAGGVSRVYREGSLGVAKNETLANHWDEIQNSIYRGTYKVPASALVGRPK